MDQASAGAGIGIMDKEATLNRVRYIVAQMTRLPVERITAEASPKTVEEWDSLAQVNIVLSLEQEFGARFLPDEIERMTSVKGIGAVLSDWSARYKKAGGSDLC